MQFSFVLHFKAIISVQEGKQWWRCDESTRLSPMWPRFDSRTRRHKWIEFVLILFSASRVFPPGSPVFLPQQKPSYSWFQLAASCAPRSHMDRLAAARGAFVCFRFDLVELPRCCTLRRQLALTNSYYYYYSRAIFDVQWPVLQFCGRFECFSHKKAWLFLPIFKPRTN